MIQAIRILFDPAISHLQVFRRLQLPEVRRAYRKRAFLVHPDRVAAADEEVKKRSTEAFIEVNWAYRQIAEFIKKRDRHPGSTVPGEKRRRPGPAVRPPEEKGRVGVYRGVLPRRPLLFGEFFYYSGLIPWKTLIEALMWQRRQRPRFGEIARRWFQLSVADIDRIMAERRPLERIGEAAVRQRLLTRFQANTILCHQRLRRKRIGGYFVKNGYLTEAKMEELLIHFEKFNRQFRPGRFRGMPKK